MLLLLLTVRRCKTSVDVTVFHGIDSVLFASDIDPLSIPPGVFS